MTATRPDTATPSHPSAPPPATAVAAAAPRERLLALDVFRGMTVAGMLLVNNPGSWSHIFPPLEHAAWNGWTPTDLIFPYFLFIVGITAHLSLSARRARGDDERAIMRQIIRRGALIFLFGLALNWFPGYTWGEVPGISDPSLLDRIVARVEHLRVMGVLQRIGLVYLVGGLLTLRGTWRQHVALLATILVGYWALMLLVPVPDTGVPGRLLSEAQKDAWLSAWLDRTLLTPDHLWVGADRRWDPEGLLSSLPAIGTMLLGQFAGRWLGDTARPLAARLNGLFAVGALLMMAGLIWHWAFPINKSLWTSSYVVFTGGLAAVTLATCMWLIDVQGWRRWTTFFEIYGTNPMIAFLGSGIMARLTVSLLKVETAAGPRPVAAVLHETLFASWLAPRVASLAYAISFVLVWFVILLVLWRRRIFLKV